MNTHVWFSRQGARLQEALLSVARVVAVERDEEILGRTETEQRLVGVLSGSALVSIEGLDGEMHPLHAVRGGTWLASRPDPGQVHRGFVAKALEPSSFVVIRMSDIAAEVQRDPVLAKDIASILDYTQDLLIACGVDLLIRETDRRVGAVLLRLSGMASIEEGLATPRTIALPQRLIGQIANASRDSVNRVLAGFAARSWITVDYGRIEVTNPEGLRRFANGG